MQIKTTMRYHLTPVRMAIINKSTKNKFDQGCKKRNPHDLWVGMKIGGSTTENSMEFPQKVKNGSAL